MKMTTMLLAALFTAACNGPAAPTAPNPVATPTPAPAAFTLTGEVKGFGGGDVDGTTIKFEGIDGPAAGTVSPAVVVNGTYFVDRMQPGNYRVSINSDRIQPHVDEVVTITASPRSFSVLRWDDSIYGVRYNEDFDQFLNRIARAGGSVRKWDFERKPLREIYLVTDASEETVQRVRGYLQSMVDTRLGEYFDRNVSVPVTVGPATDNADGRFLVKLEDINPDWFATAGVYEANGKISGCLLTLNRKYFVEKTFLGSEVGAINHESGHCAFMDHVSDDGRYKGQSVMSGASRMTPYDLAAARIVYGHTGFGNKYPDTNPIQSGTAALGFAAGTDSVDFNDVCVYRKPKN